jgi:hypothetical protein
MVWSSPYKQRQGGAEKRGRNITEDARDILASSETNV